MSKGVSSDKSETAKGFTKEVFGMAILLFSVLSLLCLITGSLIFYEVGAAVQGFFLGTFGYFSFAVLFYAVLLGLRLLIGKAVFSAEVRAVITAVSVMVLSLLAVIQTATVYNAEAGLNQSLAASYNMGLGGYAACSIGGWLSMLVSAPVIALLSPVGVYVLYPLLIVILLVFLFRNNIRAAIESAKEASLTKRSSEKEKKPQKAANVKQDVASSFEEEEPTFSSSQSQEEAADAAAFKRTAYFGGEFNLKTKKDRNKEDKPVYIFGGDFSSRGSVDTGVPTSGGYNAAYSADARDRKAYIMTPPPFKPERVGQPPISAVNPSAQSAVSQSETPSYDRSASSASVYSADRSSSTELRGSSSYPYSARSSSYQSGDRLGGDRLSGDSVAAQSRTYDSPSRTYDSQTRTYDSPSRTYDSQIRGYEDQSSDYVDRTSSTDNFEEPTFDSPARTNVPSEGLFNAAREAASGVSREISRSVDSGSRGVSQTARSDFDREEDETLDGDISHPRVYTPDFSTATSSRTAAHSASANVGEDSPLSQTSARAERATPTRASRAAERLVNVEEDKATETSSDYSSPASPAVAAQAPQAQSERSNDLSSQATSTISSEVDENDGYESIENMPYRYNYKRPPIDLLEDRSSDPVKIMAERTRLRQLAEDVCENFKHRGVTMNLENIVYGMSASRFEYSIPTTVSVKTITNASQDLAVWLHTKGEIRILAPIPGTSWIGIEVPNEVVAPVGLKDMLISPAVKKLKKDVINIAVGKNIMGDSVFESLTDMPHLLVAGASGTGKSVFLNSLLVSLLYTYSPEDLRLVIVDPKKLEFVDFESIPHLLFNKIITKGEEAAALLNWLVGEMQRRYDLFAAARVKKISEYNEMIDRKTQRKIPYIIVLVDEFAELMMDGANVKKSIDTSIQRLAQLARAAGISLIFATQRPSVDVIDGTIKTNFPARVCFKTSDQTNSGVVLGEAGAEKLVAKGEMLYRINGPTERAQGAYVDGKEIKRIVSYIKDNNVCYYDKGCLAAIKKAMQSSAESEEVGQMSMDTGDASTSPSSMPIVYRRAVRMVIRLGTTSKSMLQTKLGIGYNKAARIIDWMEKEGFISCAIDNKQRDIKIDRAGYETIFNEPFNEDFLA